MTAAPVTANNSIRAALDRLGRRLAVAVRSYLALPADDLATGTSPEEAPGEVERPWRSRWDQLPKRTAGPGFGDRDYAEARRRAEEVARLTLGDTLWEASPAPGLRRHPVLRASRHHLPAPRRSPDRSPFCARRDLALAPSVSLHQPHLPIAGGGVLRPPLPLRPRQRRRGHSGCRAPALGSGARTDVLDT